jgi:hypothetical protein
MKVSQIELEEFYESFVSHFWEDEEGKENLIEAIKTHDYRKVTSTMVSAYLMWMDARN